MLTLVARFETYLAIERNSSPHTRSAYRRDLEDFCRFLATTYDLTSTSQIQEIDRNTLRRYLAQIHPTHNKATINRKLSTLRSFFRYLVREGIVAVSPAANLSAPRIDRYLPSVLTVDEAATLMDARPASDELSLRDRAIVELLYSCGLRVSEAVGLDVGHLDFAQALVRVLGKGRKERIVPVGSKAQAALHDFLAQRAGKAWPTWEGAGSSPLKGRVQTAHTRKLWVEGPIVRFSVFRAAARCPATLGEGP
jgi:integrase/recombinase XerC